MKISYDSQFNNQSRFYVKSIKTDIYRLLHGGYRTSTISKSSSIVTDSTTTIGLLIEGATFKSVSISACLLVGYFLIILL